MAYNNTGYNSVAYNTTGVVSDGGATSASGTPQLGATSHYNGTAYNSGSYNDEGGELAFAFEGGETGGKGTLNVLENGIAFDVGAISATGSFETVEIGFAFEDGDISGIGELDTTETSIAIAAGAVDATGTFAATDISFAFEDGETQAVGDFDITEQRIDFVFRTHTRDVDLSFKLQRDFEFSEDKTMTEITEIEDTITNETRKLEFTAKEDGNKKDISGADIKWSLADNNGVVLDESDPEVSITIVDALSGRFDVGVDTIDADAGVYRQRVELTDGKGRVTRSTGTYRLKPF